MSEESTTALEVQAIKYAVVRQYARTGRKQQSAMAAGTSWNTVVALMKEDPAFKLALDEAKAQFAEHLEETAYGRGVTGWLEPVYQGGKQVGEVRKYDSTLLQMMLRTHDPRYREKLQVDMDVTTKVLVVPGMQGMGPVAEAQWEAVHRAALPSNGNGNGGEPHNGADH